MPEGPVVVALASELKGNAYLAECKRQGYRVVVVMDSKLEAEPWPWEAMDEHFGMPDVSRQPDVTYAVSYLARSRRVALVVGLDDYDVEVAASLREHLRLPGLGDTRARLFRDKIAIRVRASERGLPVPPFTGLFNDAAVNAFLAEVPPPWVLKPRTLAGSEGVRKLYDAGSVWRELERLGDGRSLHLLEQFIPGAVYHVDGLCWQDEVVFALASGYGEPPMSVLQNRGIFTTQVLPRRDGLAQDLLDLNARVLSALGRGSGPTHTEFIRAEDGKLYFLETAARVGGGNIELLVEAASGVLLWQEAARIDIALHRSEPYAPPELREACAGLIACFSRVPYADTSGYTEPEIRYRPRAAETVTLVVAAAQQARVEALLASYALRFRHEFM